MTCRSYGKPAFTVLVGEKVFNIWANGRTEGFEDGEKPLLVINRIPQLIGDAASGQERRRSLQRERELLEKRQDERRFAERLGRK